jgi:hypothetical protein
VHQEINENLEITNVSRAELKCFDTLGGAGDDGDLVFASCIFLSLFALRPKRDVHGARATR